MHWYTVTPLLKEVLEAMMEEPLFKPFRLVGGTALSLQRGHRISVDIDLFTDATYGSLNFASIDAWLRAKYPVCQGHHVGEIGFGTSYYVGYAEDEVVKIDLYYTDPFIRDEIIEDGIRMASVEDIVAMKMNMVGQRARKKDFWDVHEVMDNYSTEQMVALYLEREPYGYSEKELKAGFTNFENAEDDFDPHCLRGKAWEIIKLDFIVRMEGTG